MGTINVFDVGGERAERKKWIHEFELVNMIIFLVDIVGYNRRLFEDEDANDMVESQMLFESIANSQWCAYISHTDSRLISRLISVEMGELSIVG